MKGKVSDAYLASLSKSAKVESSDIPLTTWEITIANYPVKGSIHTDIHTYRHTDVHTYIHTYIHTSSDPESHPKVGFESVSGFGFRVSGFVD